MPEATISSKYQVTIPMDTVRSLGLKAGDKLIIRLVGDHIVMLPRPESWATWAKGRLKGLYGNTVEDVDRYVAEERASWGPPEAGTAERIEDLLASSSTAPRILHVLKERGSETYGNLIKRRSVDLPDLDRDLHELEERRAVKSIKVGADTRYRLTEYGRILSRQYPVRAS